MATVTKGRTFVSGETVTPTKLNDLADLATVSNIVNADISSGAAIDLSKLATGALPTAITVASANIADSAITSAKIADGTIVNADISASAAIASTKLETTAQQSLVPAGAVMPFAMNSAPSGWLAADGSQVSRTTYATLFAAIGTTHGAGNGSTTFNLPDLRGIFVRGSGSQTISGITYNKAFAAKEGDAFQSHGHNTYVGGSLAGYQSFSGSGFTGFVPSAGTTNADANDMQMTATNLITFLEGTPRTASETRPANIALLYCIKF